MIGVVWVSWDVVLGQKSDNRNFVNLVEAQSRSGLGFAQRWTARTQLMSY